MDMKFSNWLMTVGSQLVTWWTRPRNVGLGMMRWCGLVLVGAFSSGFVLQLQAGSDFKVLFSTAEGAPAAILYAVSALAGLGFFVGGVIAWQAHRQETRLRGISRILVAELRGLVDTSDRPLTQAVPANLTGRIEDCLVDVRQQLAGTPDVPAALHELGALATQVRRARGGTAREHVSVVVGGVLQVPLLFYAGVLLDDEGRVEHMDWDRINGRWRQLDEADDGSRFQVTGLQAAAGPEAVLAVSASYLVDLDGVKQTFPDLPLVHLERPNAKPNTLWSAGGQAALTAQFLDTLVELQNRGVKTVHLVLAASASLALRMGRVYDPKNHLTLRCYEWKRGHVPAYPWSVQMPTASTEVRYLPTTPPPAEAADEPVAPALA